MLKELMQQRFKAHPYRHPHLDFDAVWSRLSETDIEVLRRMEESGGEPDMIERDGVFWAFADTSRETPKQRVSLCYDDTALRSRKKNPPAGSAQTMAGEIGSALLTEEEYRFLQTLDVFDEKTSSWVLTDEDFRAKGGALFCERRFGRVFIYCNGAESYYSVRGFRTKYVPGE